MDTHRFNDQQRPDAAQCFAYKVAGASEPASYTYSNGGGTIYPCAILHRITGAGASPTFDVQASLDVGADNSREFSGLTCTVDGSLQLLHTIGYNGTPDMPEGWYLAAVNDSTNRSLFRNVNAGALAGGVIVHPSA